MKTLPRHFFAILLVLAVTVPSGVLAQDKDSARKDAVERLKSWRDDQFDRYDGVESFSAHESIHQAIDGGFGKRNLRVETLVSGSPTEREVSRLLTSVHVNGVDLDPKKAQQTFRTMRSMFNPEVVRLMDSYVLPVDYIGQFDPTGPPQFVEHDSSSFWQISAVRRPERQIRPGDRPGERPPGGRMRPGMGGFPGRSGRRPPGRNGPPGQNGSPPGGGPPGSGNRFDSINRPATDPFRGEARPAPPEEIVALFDSETFRLKTTRLIIKLPGRARLVVRTRYRHIHGLDVPIERTIDGTVPTRRRNRVFAVSIRQRVTYSDYLFESK